MVCIPLHPYRMADLKTYGTPEFYADMFSDCLADADGKDPKYGDNLVKGFLLALDDWLNYHKEQVDEYERIKQRVRQALAM